MVQEELDQKLDLDLEEHYAEVFQHLLWVEEQQMGGNISSYNMKNAKLKRIPDCSYLDLQVRDQQTRGTKYHFSLYTGPWTS